jgi:membrane-associated phospholipid phosphatase
LIIFGTQTGTTGGQAAETLRRPQTLAMSVRGEAGERAARNGSGAPATVGPGGPPTRSLAVLGVLLAAGLIAVTVWVLTSHLRPTPWDVALHAAGLHHRAAGLTTVAVAVSASSEYLAYVVAAVGVMLAMRPRPWWFGAVAGLLVLAVGQGVRVALAAAIGRSRPPKNDWEMHAAGFSFPSGHTATATLAAGLLCLGLICWARGVWRFAVMAVLGLWALLDGVGRVYLGVHWPTDVLAGWLLGALLTVLAAALFVRVRAHRERSGEA